MKFITATYLRDIISYELRLFVDKKSTFAISVKKINKIKEPFVLCEEGKDITLLDDGFYLLEYVPFDKDYICRVHLNNNGEVVERFFSASKNNMMQDGVPCFEDLKYSYVCSSAAYKEYNKEALISLLNEKKIDEKDYNAACKTINLIKDEIENSSNFIFNLDYKKYIF